MIEPFNKGEFVPGYLLRTGTGLDRALLVKFMQHTYQELYPGHTFAHLAQTVDRYLAPDNPLWWVVSTTTPFPLRSTPIACLWLGTAVDQVTGAPHPYIFLLYVSPEHRRRGIGTALMQYAEAWAIARGDRQIGLQVFHHNQPALRLYEQLGYQPQALLLIKRLDARGS